MARPRLTRNELELMDVLWRLGEGTVQDVCDSLERDLAYTTVMTTLRILHSKKRVLTREKRGKAHVYRTLVSREEVSHSILADLKPILFRDHLPKLMLNLIEEDEFTAEDLQTLKDALEGITSRSKESS